MVKSWPAYAGVIKMLVWKPQIKINKLILKKMLVIKKAEGQRIDAFKLWYWRRLFKVLWTARRLNQSVNPKGNEP